MEKLDHTGSPYVPYLGRDSSSSFRYSIQIHHHRPSGSNIFCASEGSLRSRNQRECSNWIYSHFFTHSRPKKIPDILRRDSRWVRILAEGRVGVGEVVVIFLRPKFTSHLHSMSSSGSSSRFSSCEQEIKNQISSEVRDEQFSGIECVVFV